MLLLALAGDAWAVVPEALSFQGVLRNNMGQLQSMTLNGSVAFFTNSTSGFQLGPTHTFSNVPAQNGLFTLVVGDSSMGSELTVAGATQVWVEITITGIGTFPRQELWSSLYAFEALSADSLASSYIVPISNGGTGSSTQNFVDLTTVQTIGVPKTFANGLSVDGHLSVNLNGNIGEIFGGEIDLEGNGAGGNVIIWGPGQLSVGTTVGGNPPGTEPLNTMGGGSGLSMNDRLDGGPTRRWVVFPQAGNLNFYSQQAGGTVYSFSSAGTALKPGGGSWAALSDERLKNVAGAFKRGLKELMRLEPIRYRYRPGNAMHASSDEEHIGFGAQSVQRVIPEAVLKNSEGYLTIENDPILWTMLNAIKEQQAMITDLRGENDTLRQRIGRLEQLVGR
jgi:hypothetical protein